MAETITIIDDRTGKQVTVPITGSTFPSSALRQLDPKLRMYDPAFLSTAACKSAITYLDGDAGILRYRGYPIEQLAEKSTFLEVAYLLLNGELPNAQQLETWKYDVTHHTMIHENMRKRFVDGFHHDAHPMGMFISATAALGTFYTDAKDIDADDSLYKQTLRLIAKSPTIAAMCYRFSTGLPFVSPNNSLDYSANFLNMMFRIGTTTESIRRLPRRWTCCSSCTPTTNRTAAPPPCAWWVHRMPTRTARRLQQHRLSTARCTVAPTKPWCACCKTFAASTTCRHSSPTSKPARAD